MGVPRSRKSAGGSGKGGAGRPPARSRTRPGTPGAVSKTKSAVAVAGEGTIHAVADRAQVSISTVSRFLNGKKRLAADTEKRILAAVAHLGYAPNRVAQSLRQGRTNTVGLILPDSGNPFFSNLVSGAENTLREAGFALVLFNSAEDVDREQECLRTLQALRCDGALLIPAPEGRRTPEDVAARWQVLSQLRFPLVFLGRVPSVEHDLVVVDNESGGFEAGRYLTSLGHKRLAIIGPDYLVSSQQDRLKGFQNALRGAGVKLAKENIAQVPLTVQDGFSAATQFLQQAHPPTGIFATSNRLAIGTVAAIKARGLKCPGDVSVVGYDSYDWQDVFEPRMTTIKQPAELLGKRGAEVLLERLAGGTRTAHERIVLRAELQIRESCQAVRP